jgi:thiosulfate/3-mercaptopyruvate sulfurtransferase
MHGQLGNCNECHPGPEEAQVPPPDHRYAGVQMPSCESCHPEVALATDDVEMHQAHGADLSCQVCHSISYSSCDSCHVQISDKTGNPFFTTDATYLTFLIGRNVNKSYDRPYDYVPVRHIPIDVDSYSYYGADLLPNFNALPTWAYATPHNIQLKTPQTASCNACHGNPDLFLTADKVNPDELEANLDVIVSEIPAVISDTLQTAGTP